MPTAKKKAKPAAGKTVKPAPTKKKAKPALNGDVAAYEKAAREVIYRSCLALDRKDFKGYMDLCDPSFQYVISTYSPELRKDIVWLNYDWQNMKLLFDVLPKHVSDQDLRTTLSRHATVYTVDYAPDMSSADVVSGLQVFTTIKDGGITTLIGVAKYYDKVNLDNGTARLLSREVRLDTRMLGETGSHIPF